MLRGDALYRTEHWQELRYQAWKRADGYCERCAKPLESGKWHLHHRTYERAGKELLADVEAICVACHQLEHPDKKILTAREIRREKHQKAVAKRRAERGLTARQKKAKRQKRWQQYRRPRFTACPTCGNKLSLVEHQRRCLGIDAAPRF